jgi:chemotaxis protein methyltransferase CheR
MLSEDETENLEIRLLLEAVHEKYGYDFREYVSDSLRRRVRYALVRSGAANLGDLQHRVLVEPGLFAALLDDLTVQVSQMFRDPEFFRVFRESVIPILRTYPKPKIWHAGCASGEEVYAAAIVLQEEDLYGRSQVYATDVSSGVLERAREGIYPEAQARSFCEDYLLAGGRRKLEDYYSSAYGRIVMREALRTNVVFFQHNLVSDYALGEMHVILCRNVLIYFGAKLRERVLTMFARALCRGGFLCLGSSEQIPSSLNGLFSEFDARSRIYRLRGSA